MPKVPAVARSSFALCSTASDASDAIPPTTGIAADSVDFAAFIAASSLLPDSRPVRDRYAVNTYITPFRSTVMHQPTSRRTLASFPPGSAHSAAARPMNAYTSGTSRLRTSEVSRLKNNDEAIYRDPAPVSDPDAAAAPHITGSSSLEYASISSSTEAARPSILFILVANSSVIASAPVMA